MDLKILLLVVGGIFAVGLVFLVFSSSLGIIFAILAILGAIAFLWLAKKEQERFNPTLRMAEKMKETCKLQGAGNLQYLVLSGSYRQQESRRGRILGTSMWIDDSRDTVAAKEDGTLATVGEELLPDDHPKKRLYIVLYSPSKPEWFFKLPLFSLLRKEVLFACYEHQLLTKELTVGDIYVKGSSSTIVGFLEMINDLSLDSDYEYAKIKSGVYRETLMLHFEKLPTLIDEATRSDGTYIKAAGLKDDQGGSMAQ